MTDSVKLPSYSEVQTKVSFSDPQRAFTNFVTCTSALQRGRDSHWVFVCCLCLSQTDKMLEIRFLRCSDKHNVEACRSLLTTACGMNRFRIMQGDVGY